MTQGLGANGRMDDQWTYCLRSRFFGRDKKLSRRIQKKRFASVTVSDFVKEKLNNICSHLSDAFPGS